MLSILEVIFPELMKAIMEMGHGDEIVLADGNFPAGEKALYANIILKKGIL